MKGEWRKAIDDELKAARDAAKQAGLSEDQAVYLEMFVRHVLGAVLLEVTDPRAIEGDDGEY